MIREPARALPVIGAGLLLLALGLGACSPFGDDDDDSDDNGPGIATPTREVVVSTFTPTEVVRPDGLTATSVAEETAAAETATARANLPTPTTPPSEVDPEELLWPPRTRLETPGLLSDSYLGTYSWQFTDTDQTYANIEAPIIPLSQGDPVEVANGDTVTIRYYGDEFRAPPQQIEVAIYDFESNSAIPVGPQGQQGEGLAFAIKTGPLQNLRVDPSEPTFTLTGFAPGHYVIWTQGRWGQHPLLDRQIFVTWVFDIEITE